MKNTRIQSAKPTCPGAGSRCMPAQQRAAQSYLKGDIPGAMQSIAPDAATGEAGLAGWQETDETVERLRRWREEAPYG